MRTLLIALVFGPASLTWAEQLPLKIYTAADGLAHNSAHRIVRDSRGYKWFCTSEGSRGSMATNSKTTEDATAFHSGRS